MCIVISPGFGKCHKFIVPSAQVVSNMVLSGEKVTEVNMPFSPGKVAREAPVRASHNRASKSLLPDASHFPSGEKATVPTGPPCPVNVARTLPVAMSVSWMAWSPELQASVELSGEKATAGY